MKPAYTTHARTPEELKAEVCSDLRRRLEALSDYAQNVAKSAAERSRLACAAKELTDMHDFWYNVQIVRPRAKPRGAASGEDPF